MRIAHVSYRLKIKKSSLEKLIGKRFKTDKIEIPEHFSMSIKDISILENYLSRILQQRHGNIKEWKLNYVDMPIPILKNPIFLKVGAKNKIEFE